mmetsp:Transcript_68702/g.119330  ORF Transcript_68702/g.119330 Transcript_68702/m.119330 type:complete len:213 (-) Transcript_68702:569-1207(-)
MNCSSCWCCWKTKMISLKRALTLASLPAQAPTRSPVHIQPVGGAFVFSAIRMSAPLKQWCLTSNASSHVDPASSHVDPAWACDVHPPACTTTRKLQRALAPQSVDLQPLRQQKQSPNQSGSCSQPGSWKCRGQLQTSAALRLGGLLTCAVLRSGGPTPSDVLASSGLLQMLGRWLTPRVWPLWQQLFVSAPPTLILPAMIQHQGKQHERSGF